MAIWMWFPQLLFLNHELDVKFACVMAWGIPVPILGRKLQTYLRLTGYRGSFRAGLGYLWNQIGYWHCCCKMCYSLTAMIIYCLTHALLNKLCTLFPERVVDGFTASVQLPYIDNYIHILHGNEKLHPSSEFMLHQDSCKQSDHLLMPYTCNGSKQELARVWLFQTWWRPHDS